MTYVFAGRLQALRKKHGMSQKELAVALDVAPGTLSNYENGVYLPPLEKACTLSKELHTSLDYLCGLTDTSYDTALLSGPATPQLSFYQMSLLFASLKSAERAELLNYSDYLKYKRTHTNYLDAPQIYRVADGDEDR